MRKYMAAATRESKSDDEQVKMSCSRRFSDEQIKSLESVFKREKKLEARKKVEMARELGLQPRQVAIWFQNRRARWKSKQVEQDYNNLKADYHTLNHRFQCLTKEKHDLLHQLSSLRSQLKDDEENIIIKELESEHDQGMAVYNSDEDHPIIIPIKQELDNIQDFDQLGTLFDHSSSNWWDIWSSN